jgi:hypothetical protein
MDADMNDESSHLTPAAAALLQMLSLLQHI